MAGSPQSVARADDLDTAGRVSEERLTPAKHHVAQADGAHSGSERLGAMASEHGQLLWRTLRRLGLSPEAADDATQQAFEVAARKLQAIRSGSEKAFLMQTAIRIAKATRSRGAARHEVAENGEAERLPDPTAGPDELLDQKRHRVVLDELLNRMPLKVRTVFVLFEIEGLATLEIAQLLSIPQGTVASRLRRGRQLFQAHLERLRASLKDPGGGP